MSDWRSRAKPITEEEAKAILQNQAPSSDWRSRAQPISEDEAHSLLHDETAPLSVEGAPVDTHKTKPGALEAFGKGGLAGATFDFDDEGYGAYKTADDALTSALIEGGSVINGDVSTKQALLDAWEALKSAPQRYAKHRDEMRSMKDDARAAHPLAYGGGQVTGALATTALLPATSGVAAATGVGAGLGALSGLGASEADSLNGMGMDTLKGGAVGGAFGAGGALVGKAISGTGSGLKRFAELKAVKALGGLPSDFSKLGIDRARQVGREVLDKDAVGFWNSQSGIAKNASTAKEAAGRQIDDALTELDSLAQPGEMFHPIKVADRVDQDVVSKIRNSPAFSQYADALEKQLAKLRERGESISLKEAEGIKRDFDRLINYESQRQNLNVPKDMLKQLRTAIAKEVEASADAVAERTGSSAGEAFKEGKQSYANLARASKIADKREAHREGLQMFGLKDTIIGAGVGGGLGSGAGHGIEGMLLGGGLAVGNKIARQRGPQMLAKSADNAGNAIQWLENAVKSNPQAFGRFATTLQRAAASGPASLAINHKILTDLFPEYRQITEKHDADRTLNEPLPVGDQ